MSDRLLFGFFSKLEYMIFAYTNMFLYNALKKTLFFIFFFIFYYFTFFRTAPQKRKDTKNLNIKKDRLLAAGTQLNIIVVHVFIYK